MRSPPIDKNPGDFVAHGSRTAIRRFNRKIPRHSESHKMKGGVLLQLTGRREGDCNGASSVIFPCAAGADITEPASVASCRGSEIRFFREDTVKFDGLRFDENLSR